MTSLMGPDVSILQAWVAQIAPLSEFNAGILQREIVRQRKASMFLFYPPTALTPHHPPAAFATVQGLMMLCSAVGKHQLWQLVLEPQLPLPSTDSSAGRIHNFAPRPPASVGFSLFCPRRHPAL